MQLLGQILAWSWQKHSAFDQIAHIVANCAQLGHGVRVRITRELCEFCEVKGPLRKSCRAYNAYNVTLCTRKSKLLNLGADPIGYAPITRTRAQRKNVGCTCFTRAVTLSPYCEQTACLCTFSLARYTETRKQAFDIIGDQRAHHKVGHVPQCAAALVFKRICISVP